MTPEDAEKRFRCVACQQIYVGIPFRGIGGRDITVKAYYTICGGCAARQLHTYADSIVVDRVAPR